MANEPEEEPKEGTPDPDRTIVQKEKDYDLQDAIKRAGEYVPPKWYEW